MKHVNLNHFSRRYILIIGKLFKVEDVYWGWLVYALPREVSD